MAAKVSAVDADGRRLYEAVPPPIYFPAKMPLRDLIGRVVRLPAGGMLMTVSAVVSRDTVSCVWFDRDELMKETFPVAALALIETTPLSRFHLLTDEEWEQGQGQKMVLKPG